MTYYQKQAKRPDIGTFYSFHHIKFYVSNALQASSFYTSRFGFRSIAYEGLETGNTKYCTQVVKLNNIILAFTSSLVPEENEVSSSVLKHSDGVKDVAFLVDDAKGIYNKAVSRGAIGISEPKEISDSFGKMIIGSLQTYGDTIHTLVQNINYTGPFLPGYQASRKKDPINEFFPSMNIQFIDHVVGNQPNNEMVPCAE